MEKSESNPHILKNDFRRLQSRYKNYQPVYTDGSKEDSKVGCAVISGNHSHMQHIPGESSIYTAEAKAADLALDFIRTCHTNNKFIIFSDSLFIESYEPYQSKESTDSETFRKMPRAFSEKEIVLCWIPSHIGILGNEMVDQQAKTSRSLEPTSFKIPFSKLCHISINISWNNG